MTISPEILDRFKAIVGVKGWGHEPSNNHLTRAAAPRER